MDSKRREPLDHQENQTLTGMIEIPRELSDVPPHQLKEIEHFFSVYKDLEDKKRVSRDGMIWVLPRKSSESPGKDSKTNQGQRIKTDGTDRIL